MATFTWDQTSGNLASTAANWSSDADSTTATQFSSSATSIPGHDGTPMQTRNSSDRLFAVSLRDSDNAILLEYTDNDWTSSTEVVVDSTLAYDSVAIAVDSADNLYVLGQINSTTMRVLRSTNAGVGWSSPSADISSGTAGSGTGCNLAIDDDDFLHMMWDDTTANFVRYCVSTIASPDPATIAVEDFKGGSAGTEQVASGAATAFFDMCLQASTRVVYENLSGGPFQEGEPVTGPSGSGIVTTLRTLELSLIIISGSFADSDAIEGGSSGATADVNGTPTTGFGVLFLYDAGNIIFRRKEDDVAWADGSSPGTVTIATGAASPSICVSDDDLVIFVSYGNSSSDASCKISTDGGDTFGSEVVVVAGSQSGTACGFGNGYFWLIHSDTVINIFYTQFYADSTLTAPVLIQTTEEDGTNAADGKRSTRIRWTRFHHNSPNKLDMVWDNTTDSRMEGRIIAATLPNIADVGQANATSTANITWDIAPTGSLNSRIASFTLDTGYSGTLTGSVSLDATGALVHNAGTLTLTNGCNIDTFTTLFNAFTTSNFLNDCNITTSLIVAGNTTVNFAATSGNVTITCPSIQILGTLRHTDNLTNAVRIQGPDTSTYCVFSSGAPDIDFAGAGAFTFFGNTGVGRGADFDTNSVSFTAGTNALLDLEERNIFHNFTFSGATVDGNASLAIVDGNWDSTSGTFTQGTSLVQFTGTGTTIATGGSSDNFNDVTVTGTSTLSGGMTIDSGGIFTNSGTLTVNAALVITGAAITNFDNSGGTINGSAIISFNNSAGGAVTIDNFGTISNLGIIFTETAGTISFGANLSVSIPVALILGTLDLATFTLTCTTLDVFGTLINTGGGTTITATAIDATGGTITLSASDDIVCTSIVFPGGTLDMTAATTTITVSSSWDSTSGTFTEGSGTVIMDGLGATMDGPATETFNNLTISNTTACNIAVDVTGAFTCTSTFTINSLFRILDAAIAAYNNTGGTIAGTGTLEFRISSATPRALPGGFGTTNIDKVIFDANGANIQFTANNFTHGGSGLLLIEGANSLDTGTFNITAGGAVDVTGTLDHSTGFPLLTVNGNLNFTGGIYVNGVNNQITFASSGNMTAAGNTFTTIGINSPVTVTLQDTLRISASIQHFGASSQLAMNSQTVHFDGDGLTPLTTVGTNSGTGTFSFNPTGATQWSISSRVDWLTIIAAGASSATFQAQGNIVATSIDITSSNNHSWDQQAFDLSVFSTAEFTLGSAETFTMTGGTFTGTIEMVASGSINADSVVFTGINSAKATVVLQSSPVALNFTNNTVIGATGQPALSTDLAAWNIAFPTIEDCTLTAGATSTIDVQVDGGGTVELSDCTLTNEQVNVVDATSGLALWGNLSGGSELVLVLWGAIDFSVDLQDATPTTYRIQPKDDDSGSNHCIATVNNTWSSLAWQAEANTTTIITTGNTLTINPISAVSNQSIGNMTGDGAFVFDQTGAIAYTMQVLGIASINATGSWSTVPGILATVDIDIDDNAQLFLNGGSLTINGNTTAIVRIRNQQVGGGGSNGNIRSAGGTIDLDFVELDTLGHSGGGFNGAINLDTGTTTGTVRRFNMHDSGVSGIYNQSGTSDVVFEDGQVTGGLNGIWNSTTNSPVVYQRLAVTGASVTGVLIDTNTFTGKLDRCLVEGTTNGLQITINATDGQIRNCAFVSAGTPTNVQAAVSFVSCMFDGSSGNYTAANIISYQHNRSNTKEVFVGSNQTVNTTYYTIVNEDIFDWQQTTLDDWAINNDNRMESQGVTDPLLSVFIPAVAGQIYYVRFRGTIGADSGTPVTLQGYEFDQLTITNALTAWTLAGNGLDYEPTAAFTTAANTAFLQFQIDASVAGLEFYDIEIREDTSGGDLIFNEDFITNYVWAGIGYQYDDGGTQLLSENAILNFGEVEYDRIDANVDITGTTATAAPGLVFAWTDAQNYYVVYMDYNGTDTLRVEKVDGGVLTSIDTAITVGGGALPTQGTLFDLEVHWNEDISGSAVTGAIAVAIDGVTITGTGGSSDWVSLVATDYVTDTSHAQGKMGFYAETDDDFFDNLIVRQFGSFFRDVNVTFDTPGPLTFTVSPGGILDWCNVTLNQSVGASIIDTGGTITLKNVGIIDFDETVTSTVTYVCEEDIEVENDVTVVGSGQLNIIGVRMKHETTSLFWTIKTEGTTAEPPMTMKACLLLNLNTRFRVIDGPSAGLVYEIDPTGEFLLRAPEPSRPPHVISHQVHGRGSHRNIVVGFPDKQVTMEWATLDNCLYSWLMCRRDNRETFEVIWPRGYIWKARVVDMNGGQLAPGGGVIEFAVSIKEWA